MTIKISAARLTELGLDKNNPFVAWNNLAANATLSGTAVLTDGARENAVDGTTHDYWLPNITGTNASFRVIFSSALTISCVGIAAHNLGTLGGVVTLQRSTDGGVTYSAAGLGGAITPTDNTPIIIRTQISGLDAGEWLLSFTGLTAGAPLYVGVILMGAETIFPRRFYKDFAPVLSPTEVQLQSNVSVGGNLLGNSIVAQGSTLQASFRNLAPSFVRGAMLPFIPHFNSGKGFFFGWRPDTYPQDVHYCWREGATLRPKNDGPLDFMGLEMQMRAFES